MLMPMLTGTLVPTVVIEGTWKRACPGVLGVSHEDEADMSAVIFLLSTAAAGRAITSVIGERAAVTPQHADAEPCSRARKSRMAFWQWPRRQELHGITISAIAVRRQ